MKIEKGVMSSRQLMYLIICLLQGSVFTAAFITGIVKRNMWFIIIISFFLMIPLLMIYISLYKSFPHKNLIEINDILFGKYIGKVISLLYIYFYWFLIPANVRYMGDFFGTFLFHKVDILIFITAIIFLGMYAVQNGIEVMARCAPVLAILTIIVFAFITIFTVIYFDVNNFLPLFQISKKNFIHGINLMIAIPFGELAAIFMFFPAVNDINKISKNVFLGFTIGTVLFLGVIMRNIVVLGNTGSIYVLPSYQVAKLIHIGEFLTRTEVLIAMNLLYNVFFVIYIFYYVTVVSIAQLLKLKSYKTLILPVGIISIVLSLSMYESSVNEGYSAGNIYPIYALPFVVIIPVISLILAWIRKLPCRK